MQFRIGNYQINRSNLEQFFKETKEIVGQKFSAIIKKATDSTQYFANLIYSFSAFIFEKGQRLAQRILPSRVKVITTEDLKKASEVKTPAPVNTTTEDIIVAAPVEEQATSTEPAAPVEEQATSTEPAASVEKATVDTTSSTQNNKSRITPIQAGFLGGAVAAVALALRALSNSYFKSAPNAQPEVVAPKAEEAQPEVVAPKAEEAQPEVAAPKAEEAQPEVVAPKAEEAQPEVAAPKAEEAQPEVVAPKAEEAQPEVAAPKAEETQPEVAAPKAEEAQPEVAAQKAEEAQPEVVAPKAEEAQPEVAAQKAEKAALELLEKTPAFVRNQAIEKAIENIIALRESLPDQDIHWNKIRDALNKTEVSRLGISTFKVLQEYSKKTGVSYSTIKTTAGTFVSFVNEAAKAAATAKLRP